MKYLVLFAVLLVVYMLWRSSARRDDAAQRGTPPPATPQEMIRCAHCGVHLPRGDALAGPTGRLYCCDEHRLRAGG